MHAHLDEWQIRWKRRIIVKPPTIDGIVLASTTESDEDLMSHSDLSVLDQRDDFGGSRSNEASSGPRPAFVILAPIWFIPNLSSRAD